MVIVIILTVKGGSRNLASRIKPSFLAVQCFGKSFITSRKALAWSSEKIVGAVEGS